MGQELRCTTRQARRSSHSPILHQSGRAKYGQMSGSTCAREVSSVLAVRFRDAVSCRAPLCASVCGFCVCPGGIAHPTDVRRVGRDTARLTHFRACNVLCRSGMIGVRNSSLKRRPPSTQLHSTRFALSSAATPDLFGRVPQNTPGDRGCHGGGASIRRAVMHHGHLLKPGPSRSREPLLGLHWPTTRARHVRAQSGSDVTPDRGAGLRVMRSQLAAGDRCQGRDGASCG